MRPRCQPTAAEGPRGWAEELPGRLALSSIAAFNQLGSLPRDPNLRTATMRGKRPNEADADVHAEGPYVPAGGVLGVARLLPLQLQRPGLARPGPRGDLDGAPPGDGLGRPRRTARSWRWRARAAGCGRSSTATHPCSTRRAALRTRFGQDDAMLRAIAVLRIFFGVVYFTNGLSKFVPVIAHLPGGYFLIDSRGAESIIRHNAAHHPVALYHDLVFNLFLPSWSVFGPLVGLAEMTAGLPWGLDGAIGGSRWRRLFG